MVLEAQFITLGVGCAIIYALRCRTSEAQRELDERQMMRFQMEMDRYDHTNMMRLIKIVMAEMKDKTSICKLSPIELNEVMQYCKLLINISYSGVCYKLGLNITSNRRVQCMKIVRYCSKCSASSLNPSSRILPYNNFHYLLW